MLPTVEPILPVLSKHVPTGSGWIYEPKLDGFRGTLYVDEQRGWFRSKTKNRMARFASLAGHLALALAVRDAIFDGEIVVMGEHGPLFDDLFSARGTPSYAAFDLLWLNGHDLRGWTLTRRKARLEKLLQETPVVYVEHVRDPALYRAAVEMDLEGIIAKRSGDPYATETRWMKVKHPGYSQAEGRGDKFHRQR